MRPAEISPDTVIVEKKILPATQAGLDEAMRYAKELDRLDIPVTVTRESDIVVWVLWTVQEALEAKFGIEGLLELVLDSYPELSDQREATRAAIALQAARLGGRRFRHAG